MCLYYYSNFAEIRGQIKQFQYSIHVIYIGFMTVKYEKIDQDSQVHSPCQKKLRVLT